MNALKLSHVECLEKFCYSLIIGPKHGKVNKKGGMPFHYDTIFIYSKGSSLDSIQNVFREHN